MKKKPTPKQVARAWHTILQEYSTRRNKAHDTKQWEVYTWVIGQPMSEESVKVLARFHTPDEALNACESLENDARAKAVLKLF